MLDIKYIRENSELVKKAAKDKLIQVDIDRLLALDTELKNIQQELDLLREERNKLSSLIPTLAPEEKKETVEHVRNLKEKIGPLEDKMATKSCQNCRFSFLLFKK